MEELIKANEKLIYKIINKYRFYFEIDDLYQIAVMGLIKAYNNYKKEYNTKFITYAYPYILGEVVKYVNDSKQVKISNEYRILYKRILEARTILTQKLMKIPTTSELALFLEIDEYLISETIIANSYIESLDKLLDLDDKNFELYNKYGYVDTSIENYPLIYEIEKLTPEERKIINARYYDDMSQSETGKSLGIHQVEVSRKEHKILQKLRNNIAA